MEPGARSLLFERPQDRILVSDPQGCLVAKDAGRTLILPGSAGQGLYVFWASAGKTMAMGTLLDMPLE